MNFDIVKNSPVQAVFSYSWKNQVVFIGHGDLKDVEYFGEFCPHLDNEAQRMLGTGEIPVVQTTLLMISHSANDVADFTATMRKQLRPTWGSDIDYEKERRMFPNILHVETGVVFASPASAASAMGIFPSRAYQMLTRPMFAKPRIGPKPTQHLVRTDRKSMHDLRYMREDDLKVWRIENGYA